MPVEERERRLAGLRSVVTARNPGDWIDEQLADIRRKGDAEAAGVIRSTVKRQDVRSESIATYSRIRRARVSGRLAS